MKKMSLANIQGKLSRNEMKEIMAGSGTTSCTCLETDPDGTCDGQGHCKCTSRWGNSYDLNDDTCY